MEQPGSILSAAAVSAAVAAAGLAALAYEGSRLSSTGRLHQRNVKKRVPAGGLKEKILALIQEPAAIDTTFKEFPYFIGDKTREVLLNVAFLHLQKHSYKHLAAPFSGGSSVLVTGAEETETYQRTLAKALAKHFDAKLLVLDVADWGPEACAGQSGPQSAAARPLLSGLLAPWLRADPTPTGTGEGGFSAAICDTLFDVLEAQARAGPLVLFIRSVQSAFLSDPRLAKKLARRLAQLPGQVLVLGSHTGGTPEAPLTEVFPTRVFIKPPQDDALLAEWNEQMKDDVDALQAQDNRRRLLGALERRNVKVEAFESLELAAPKLTEECCEEIVGWAVSNHLMGAAAAAAAVDAPPAPLGGSHLVLPAACLEYGISLFRAEASCAQFKAHRREVKTESKELQDSAGKTGVTVDISTTDAAAAPRPKTSKADGAAPAPGGETALKATTPKTSSASAPAAEPVADNEFEKRIRPEVVPAGEVGVTFASIGALENVKESLRELVMLPLQRPELFSRGGLIQPCKGILLFGPPGTGKTMLAKAVATEAKASFINISMSTITSKWFGEDEKNVRALFTLAAKLAPTVIFIDEVDSMLGRRSRVGEHEAMRKIKNEFMAQWDGLASKAASRVLVLAATNRPFDLDEAIIRRFQRRIMVGLPDAENREKILRSILEKEDLAPDVDFKALAAMSDGHSGSDLKNLCMTAAYCPIRELLEQERKNKEAKMAGGEGEEEGAAADVPVKLRSLTMEDLRKAKNTVAASVSMEGTTMQELNEWNELYGEGGKRQKAVLSYFM